MIELKNVSKSFDTAEGKVDALKDVSITIEDGDIYGIIGMSGAGKSTLVRCINMLEKPTSGEVIVNGKRLDTMSPAQLRAARRNITMIFQQFNLLMQRNCLKNVCFPMELAGASKKDAQNRAKELLALVGLPDKAKAYPAQCCSSTCARRSWNGRTFDVLMRGRRYLPRRQRILSST